MAKFFTEADHEKLRNQGKKADVRKSVAEGMHPFVYNFSGCPSEPQNSQPDLSAYYAAWRRNLSKESVAEMGFAQHVFEHQPVLRSSSRGRQGDQNSNSLASDSYRFGSLIGQGSSIFNENQPFFQQPARNSNQLSLNQGGLVVIQYRPEGMILRPQAEPQAQEQLLPREKVPTQEELKKLKAREKRQKTEKGKKKAALEVRTKFEKEEEANPATHSPSARMVNFTKLKNLLMKMSGFTVKKMTENDFNLSYNERKILHFFVRRKFKLVDYTKNEIPEIKIPSGEELYETVKKESESDSKSKRTEEFTKFALKKCIKIMKKDYMISKSLNNRNTEKPDIDRQFYEHYFGQVAKNDNIRLENFYLPGTSVKRPAKEERPEAGQRRRKIKKAKKGEVPNELAQQPREELQQDKVPKSINDEYIKRIFKSELFPKELKKILDIGIVLTLQTQAQKQITTWVEDLTEFLKLPENGPNPVNKFCYKIEDEQGLKLPWTSKEIRDAVNQLKNLVEIRQPSETRPQS